jgi:hypothetical protein
MPRNVILVPGTFAAGEARKLPMLASVQTIPLCRIAGEYE